MKVKLISELKDSYHQALKNQNVQPDELLRLCILKWKLNFDLEEMRLAPILEIALKNKRSGRLWGGEQNSIKSGLIMLAEHNPDLFWEAMKDLLNEDRMLIMRANRFIHHCDVILQDLKQPELKINTHHQSYYSASLLLSLHCPEKYCLFNFELFEHFCKKIGVLDIPINSDIERYYKILGTVYKLISKDEDFMTTYYSMLGEGVYFGPSLSLVYDLMSFAKSQGRELI